MSVDAVQAREICVGEVAFAVRPSGVEGAVPSATVTVALDDFVVSAWDVAVTDTVAGGGADGGVYKPLALTDPMLAAPALLLLTCQVTPTLVVPVTVAVNCCVWPVFTVTVCGVTVITTGCVVEPLLHPETESEAVKNSAGVVHIFSIAVRRGLDMRFHSSIYRDNCVQQGCAGHPNKLSAPLDIAVYAQ